MESLATEIMTRLQIAIEVAANGAKLELVSLAGMSPDKADEVVALIFATASEKIGELTEDSQDVPAQH